MMLLHNTVSMRATRGPNNFQSAQYLKYKKDLLHNTPLLFNVSRKLDSKFIQEQGDWNMLQSFQAALDAHLGLEACAGVQGGLQAFDDLCCRSLVCLQIVTQFMRPLFTCHLHNVLVSEASRGLHWHL